MAVTFSPRSVVILRGDLAAVQLGPHPSLRALVSSYWAVRFEGGPHTIRSLPDGCADIVFDLGARAAYVSGPQPEAREFEIEAGVSRFGVRIAPGGAATLLGRAPRSDELWVPLDRFVDRADELAARIADAEDTAARCAILDELFLARMQERADPRLLRAIGGIFDSGGTARIAAIAKAAGASERTLSRLFEDAVGISPKRFARIVRFQRVLRRIDRAPHWARIAGELGYVDQAHMVRDFKSLFGCTPEEAIALERL